MHKNLEKLINLALIGAITTNNAIVLAEGLDSTEIVENSVNMRNEEPILISESTVKTTTEDNATREGTLEINLNEGENIPDLTNLEKNYSTLIIKTLGNKELDLKDYSQIKYSNIPNIDLSGAFSKTIPSGAFYNCTFLENFKFPQGLINIGESSDKKIQGAFENCTNLTGILDLPDSLQTIGDHSFSNCINLKGDLIIPNSVTSISDFAFYECSGFTGELTISKSLTSIGAYAFAECSGFTGDLIIPNSVTSISQRAFYGCSGFTGSLHISESLTSIEHSVFNRCSGLTGTLNIPNSVTSIDAFAFEYCSGFTGDLIIPDSVTSIGQGVFSNCSGFTGSLTIPTSIKVIESFTFLSCSGLTGDLIIPDSVTSIGYESFSNCPGFTGTLNIPNSVTSIGAYAFKSCSGFTGNLVISNSVTSIGQNAFYKCSGFTGDLVIPNSVTSIGSYAFLGCSGFTGNLVIPESVTLLRNGAFANCSGFTGDLVIPNSITSIESATFSGCSGFTGTLTIPDSVTSIGDFAFKDCSNFKGELIIPKNVNTIGTHAFYSCSGFTGDLIIPDSVMSIGEYAFYYCSGFNGIFKLSNSIKTLPHSVFYGCSNLTGDLIIPESITYIDDYAFYKCSSLNGNLILPKETTFIGSYAFAECSKLTGSLTIPENMTSISNNSFSHCSSLTGGLVIPESVTSIGNYAFSNCSNLTSELIIPNSVSKIGVGAFSNCSNLTGELTIPESVTSIGDLAFKDCFNITGELFLPNSIVYLGADAFKGTKKTNGTLFISSSTKDILNYNLYYNKSLFKNIIFYINTDDILSNYGKKEFDKLIASCKDTDILTIETPYELDIQSSWLKDYTSILKKPTLSILDDSILDNPENEIYTSKTTLNIPSLYDEKDIKIKKDNVEYPLPNKNEDGSYTFKDLGTYTINLKTTSGTVSNIDFEVESFYGSTTINYIDEETKEILDTETANNLKMGEYKYESKEIDGYDLNDDLSKNVIINRTNKNQTIEFKYLKTIKGLVNIKYINDATGKELIPSEIKSNLALDTYIYEAKEIDGYTLIGESSTSVELTRTNPNKTIEFRYYENVDDNEETGTPEVTTGSVTIKYIDDSTRKEIAPSDSKTNLSLGNYTYNAKEIDGYSLIGEPSVSIELTKDNPNKTIEFRYSKNKEDNTNEDDNSSNELVATKEAILDAINKDSDLNIIGGDSILKIYNTTLIKLKDLTEDVILTIQDKTTTDSSILNLIKREGLNVVDSFNAYINLSDLEDNYLLNIGRNIDAYNGKKLYLYRLNENSRSVSLQYVGEYDVITGIARFDIDSKLLNDADFIITSNKRAADTINDNTTNNPNDDNDNKPSGDNNNNNNNSNSNNNSSSEPNNDNTSDKEDLVPNLGGLSNIISSLSIASILSGLYISIKNKKKR